MNVLYDIQDMLYDEMKDICKQDKLSSSDVEDLYRMVDIIKDITTIEAMKNSGYGEYSRGYYGDDAAYMRGPSMQMGRSYDYSRNRDRDGYSGHDGKEGLIEKLNMAMMNARNDEDREQYRRAMEQLKR